MVKSEKPLRAQDQSVHLKWDDESRRGLGTEQIPDVDAFSNLHSLLLSLL